MFGIVNKPDEPDLLAACLQENGGPSREESLLRDYVAISWTRYSCSC